MKFRIIQLLNNLSPRKERNLKKKEQLQSYEGISIPYFIKTNPMMINSLAQLFKTGITLTQD